MIRFVSFLVLWACATISGAQGNLIYLNKITTEEGLSETTNWFLHEDQEGFVWIGSLDGVNLYDGKEMTVFKAGQGEMSIKGQNVSSPFFETSKGDIWFATNEAINGYLRQKRRMISKTLKVAEEGDTYNIFHLENDRYAWTSVNGKLYRSGISSENQDFEQLLLPAFSGIRGSVVHNKESGIYTMVSTFWRQKQGLEIISFEKRKNALSLSTEIEEELEICSRDTFFSSLSLDNLPELTITNVFIDEQETVWALARETMIVFESLAPESYDSIPAPFPGARILSFATHNDQWLKVLLDNGDLYFFDKTERKFSNNRTRLFDLDSKDKLTGLNRVFPGRDSTVWFAAPDRGVYYGNLAEAQIQSLFPIHDIEHEAVKFIFEDARENIHIIRSNAKGIVFDQQQKLLKTGTFPPMFRCIDDGQGRIWGMAGRGTLFCYTLDGEVCWSQNLEEIGKVYDLIQYSPSLLLIAAANGVFFYATDRYELISTNYNLRTVKLFLDKGNRLWTGNSSGDLELWEINPQNISVLKHLYRKPYNVIINDIVGDPSRGCIWLASGKGLTRIMTDSFQDSLISEKEGLANQYIRSVVLDTKGRLWLSTNKGIVRYLPEEAPSQRFRQYTTRDGLGSNEFERDAALLASNGSVWFGSTKGVDVFNPYTLHDVGHAPKLVLKNLKIHDKPWNNNATSCSLENLELTYQQNTLAFELTALEYTDPSRNQFMVQLEYEGNADTTFLGTQNRITYANLSPGAYVFRFTACNAEGIWQEEWYELPIVINPPFTQTWWFRLLVILGLMALVGFILTLYYRYQLREQQLELERQERQAERERLQLETKLNLEQERTRIASDFHDEIGGGLSTIRNASAVAARKEDVEDIRSVLQRVSEISLGLIGNMRAIIWAMDPGFDSLDDLGTYIRGYTKEFLNDNGLASQLDIPIDLPQVGMNGKARHNLLLVIKESLHNIVKHAQATEVDFKLEINHQLLITIADNGKGFDPAKLKRRGSGLKNMKKRIQSIGGNIKWEPNEPQGTRVVIQYPITPTA